MADVLIRGLCMPKYTTKAEFGIDADGNPLCLVYHDGTDPDIYDVVPIPEGHGKLIDIKDVESKKFHIEGRAEMYSAYNTGWNDALDAVCMNVHPIVPAEGGKGNADPAD